MRDAEFAILVALGCLVFINVIGFQLVLENMQQPTRIIYVHRGGKDDRNDDREAG